MKSKVKPQRKRNRLTEYDYSQAGYYFVTICTKNRENYFGEIKDTAMECNSVGVVTKKCFEDIPEHFNLVAIDQYIIMPNHIHGILVIHHPGAVGTNHGWSQRNRNMELLPKVISQFKSSVTRLVRQQCENVPFAWQKSYYDHIIRSDNDLHRIRAYIRRNPLKWSLDKENSLRRREQEREQE